MKQPTAEEKKELWEKCGLKRPPPSCKEPNHMLVPMPKGNYGDGYCLPIDLDLNNLFKYATPIVRTKGVSKIVFLYFEDDVWCQFFGGFNAQEEIACGKAETEEDALFWAIWEVIHE